jgi:Tol biopolymer transport system component
MTLGWANKLADRVADLLKLFVIFVGILFISFACGFAYAKGDEVKIERFSISPDGKIVAFEYLHPKLGRSLGLWEWQTGKLTPIFTPSNASLRDGDFTPDGKHLLSIAYYADTHHLVSIDLATLQATELAKIDRTWSSPILQPGTDKVIFVVNEGRHYLISLDIKTGEVTTILKKYSGFKALIGTPYFIGKDEIVFDAMAPLEPDLHQQIASLGIAEFENIVCRMRFGAKPELMLTDQVNHKTKLKNAGISSISASRDGRILAFVGLSLIQPRNEEGAYNLEIFTVRDGVVNQVTNLRSYLALANMSLDGSAIVFSSVPNRHTSSNPRFGNFYPYVLDLHTGKITQTNLVELLQQDTRFNQPQ